MLRALVHGLPLSQGDFSEYGLHAGAEEGERKEEGESASASSSSLPLASKFVDQLNWILSRPATHPIAQLSLASIHEVIAETLSKGA